MGIVLSVGSTLGVGKKTSMNNILNNINIPMHYLLAYVANTQTQQKAKDAKVKKHKKINESKTPMSEYY